MISEELSALFPLERLPLPGVIWHYTSVDVLEHFLRGEIAFSHYHPEADAVMNAPKSIIMREYSAAWKSGDEPYYPIDNADSRELLSKYRVDAATIPNRIIGGRLGAYKYYDMDKSIESAMKVEI